MKEETISFVMLFCALILVKKDKASLEDSITIVPLFGGAKLLAGELASMTCE